MSECILPSSSNCTGTKLHNNWCVQMPSACICNFTHWLRQCDPIRHTKPSHAPSGNGAAVGGTNHPPDPTRWSTINVRGTEAIALASREIAHRVQAISSCTLCALRRHTGVPRLAAAPSYATPLPTLCRRFTSTNSTCQPRTLRSRSSCVRWPDAVEQWNRAQFRKTLKTFLFLNWLLCFIRRSV